MSKEVSLTCVYVCIYKERRKILYILMLFDSSSPYYRCERSGRYHLLKIPQLEEEVLEIKAAIGSRLHVQYIQRIETMSEVLTCQSKLFNCIIFNVARPTAATSDICHIPSVVVPLWLIAEIKVGKPVHFIHFGSITSVTTSINSRLCFIVCLHKT